ncbi:hypothetical protein SAMN04488004_12247 [Loktanella salsilacus]|uniref:DUF3800 domain-containing protein n=1 Tax=Loktanella salsilacus TaxID=195913 RepID=A0A1I4I4C5_9RHOB|nr:DUF3800 domain-containing protein [Loktanella salsilacus]SFL49104.1 hypothetical protein SAMN04488004_12247 [Loktanella salsilacus]
MFAYIDETGHSGRNIFDVNENFQLGTLLSKINIATSVGEVLDPFLKEKGVERLHANEWPEYELVDLSHSVLDSIGECGPWVLNIFSVHKPYIAPTKFVDMIFDPGENNATPGHWYWDEMHRHVLCLVSDSAMNRELAKKFWEAFLNDDAKGIVTIATEIAKTVRKSSEPAAIKKVFRNSIKWAKENQDEFTLLVTEKRKGYQGHSPNVIAFTQAFQAIHHFCKIHGCQPETLVHDQQQEFQSELKRYYEEFGQMVILERGDGKFPSAEMAPYPKGKFTLMPSTHNRGLQAVDLLLWISQREVATDHMKVLKERIEEHAERYYISRAMSQAIVNMHLLKR